MEQSHMYVQYIDVQPMVRIGALSSPSHGIDNAHPWQKMEERV